MTLSKRGLCAVLAAGSAVPMCGSWQDAIAAYPEQPVKIVVGFAAGSGSDILTRLVGKEMAKDLGQAVIVENRSGSGGSIAAREASRSKGDGYTLFLASRPNLIHRAVYGSFRYDMREDFRPIGLVARVPMVLLTGRHTELKSVDELVRRAREDPGAIKCATPAPGTTGHLLYQLFQMKSNVSLLQVPYRSPDPAFADLIGGRVDTLFMSLAVATPYLEAGSVRALAVFSPERSAMAPDIPTVEELGLPSDLHVDSWQGLVAPEGTPPEVIERLNKSLNTVLSMPSLQEALQLRGFAPPSLPNTAASFGQLMAQESERWGTLIEKWKIAAPLH
ncbi:Bug family tripartite tricarboxylate transporter substrate binding protein [Achromobacter aloeverae]|uniref:MFS transporter n=1 Tax=Achromobacter aloeverae TaxID=1750518 RepID=A0A4Q1HNP9_9BURK|nr:tripartite tricarboxylate transporter substrate binding protein [Achromobacter aloeverae]RXN92654.1 MFS transporter [Achromobacter aloeverae]